MRGLPHLPQPVGAPGVGSSVPASDDLSEPLSARHSGAVSTDQLMTPWIIALSTMALEQIRAEELAYLADCAVWERDLVQFRLVQDLVTEEVAAAKERLELAQRPLTDQASTARQLGEHGQVQWPDGLVAERRQVEWDLRLRAAERAYRDTAARLAEAVRQAELREELRRDRLTVAQAAARRHHESAMRRIATYQRQLVRRHPRGTDLSLLMMSHPVGRTLPYWVSEPSPPGSHP